MKVVYQNLQKNNISRMSSPQIIMISKDKILCMEEEVESVNFGINKGKNLVVAIKKYKHFILNILCYLWEKNPAI